VLKVLNADRPEKVVKELFKLLEAGARRRQEGRAEVIFHKASEVTSVIFLEYAWRVQSTPFRDHTSSNNASDAAVFLTYDNKSLPLIVSLL